MMRDDAELLREYAQKGSEEAFAELVRRHVDFIHSVAMRWSRGDSEFAADVTQKVFVALAQNARKVKVENVLTGWLYTATRNAARDAWRSEQRRIQREQDLTTMYELHYQSNTPALRERLMEEIDRLNERDREVVLL